MAISHQETFLPIPDGDIPKGKVIYQDQLVLTSINNKLHLRQQDVGVTLPQSDLSQHMPNLQLESFTGLRIIVSTDIFYFIDIYAKTSVCLFISPLPSLVAFISTNTEPFQPKLVSAKNPQFQLSESYS
ncbi:hypothetical protein DSO57_1021359 [Entomophthora muscae]|uniref:Uncharacterized protein n=1 Tax=Entomophthora muscae TaxID=34485 RepID=A0ACC2UDV3_9FUNG|nr:hypothetical protein DSO57_1021359 [Entomophthora muscae]